MVAQMLDEFTVAVTMTQDEAEAHAERAIALMRPHIEVFEFTHTVGNVMQGVYHNVSVDDLRVKFEHDYDHDYDYIEQFDTAEEYDAWMEREDAFNKAPRFKSTRPETRQFDGYRFNVVYDFGQVRDENNKVTRRGRPCLPGRQWWVVDIKVGWFNADTKIVRRLAHVSEVCADFDEYMKGHGNLNNYVSYVAVLERRVGTKVDRYGDITGEWEMVECLGGIDFYIGDDAEYERTPDETEYTLSELKQEPFRWVAEDNFGIDFSKVPD